MVPSGVRGIARPGGHRAAVRVPSPRHGRSVAEFVAEQTGGSVEFRAPEDNLPPGTIYGAPGTLPLREYRPLPDWLREQAEGPFPRDEQDTDTNPPDGE